MNMRDTPIVWTIAGCDPSGRAGILSDCRTLNSLHVTAFAITTAITSQNGLEVLRSEAVSCSMIESQFHALRKLGWPKVITR
jgi:hydroxymethylpyrimidine/phosphomethylpyrimidine kinase